MSDDEETRIDETDELAQRFAAYDAARTDTPEPVAETVEAPEETETTEDTETEANPTVEGSETEETAHADEDEQTEAQKRIDRLYFEAREAKREAKRLQLDNERLQGNRVETHDETVTREAYAMAQKIAKEQIWIKDSNRIHDAGVKEIKDWNKTIQSLVDTFGINAVPFEITEAAKSEPGQEHKIIAYYGRNLDLAEQLVHMTPVERGAAVARVAAKLNPPKQVSKMTPPHKPVGGGSKSVDAPAKDLDKRPLAEQIAHLDAQELKARIAKFS